MRLARHLTTTMSDFRKLADLFRLAIDALTSSREADAVQVASNTLALVEDRIISTRKDADGVPFPNYSTRKMPASRFAGKSRSSGAEARVNAERSLSYARFRELNNLQAQNYDFYLTGEMWRGTGVIVQKRLLRSTFVTIGGRTPQAAKKIDLNSARVGGSILEPSKVELAEVQRAWLTARRNRLTSILGR